MSKSSDIFRRTALLLLLTSFTSCTYDGTSSQDNPEYDDPVYSDYITYEQFGAAGDGKTDDLSAIAAAHKIANRLGLPVRAKDGSTYYIGGAPQVVTIKTDVDWGTAKFIIDDLEVFNYSEPVFRVEASESPYTVTVNAPVRKGQTNLGVTLDKAGLVCIVNNAKKVYIREGLNQNNGYPQQEVLLVSSNGDIDPSTTPVWDYDNISLATVYPEESLKLTIKGGEFTTYANQNESKYSYVKRGIEIERSNVLVENVKHYVYGELSQGAPYAGFIITSYASDVEVLGCTFTGHTTYRTIGSAGKPVDMGTYEFSSDHCINVALRNCTQSNSIYDTGKWGVYTSNFSKNLSMEGCTLSRFDAHMGVTNVTLKNCVFGHQGVRMVGFGKLLMEDCTCRTNYLIALRGDYGSSWEGDVEVKDCVIMPGGTDFSAIHILNGSNAHLHDFGYECRLPDDILIDGLTIEDVPSTNKDYKGPFVFSDFKKDAPVNVRAERVTIKSGKPLQVCENPELFTSVVL